MKGAALSACCNVLGDLAGELQQASEDQKIVPGLVEKIAGEFESAREAIKGLVPDK